MFKNFFRKVRATLKNSPEAIALATGFLAPGMSNPMAKMAMKYLPQIATSQYQDNPLAAFLQNQVISTGGQYLRGNNPLSTMTNQPKTTTINPNVTRDVNYNPILSTDSTATQVADRHPLFSGFFDAEGD